MATESYRQGFGLTKTIKALGPVQREDGSPLPVSEIAHYLRFISYNGSPASSQVVQLIDDAGTPEYDGSFDEVLDIDSQAAGTYTIWYRTVDIHGLESRDSEIFTLVVEPPLARPNPPTDLSTG